MRGPTLPSVSADVVTWKNRECNDAQGYMCWREDEFFQPRLYLLTAIQNLAVLENGDVHPQLALMPRILL